MPARISVRWRFLVALCVAGVSACAAERIAALDAPPTFLSPEIASASVAKTGWATRTYAVAAANPLATEAGQQMLRAGGSAVDAAIAVQMVLALVEPQSSGLGGGAFLIHFDGKQVQAFDGRETAPAGVTATELMGSNGQPMARMQAIVGGRTVGVPGTLRMLELAHRQHGRLPWAALFAPAIRLAQQGFAISPRMASLVADDKHLHKDPVAAAYFYDADGKPWPAGHVLRNPELADVLQAIAKQGADAFMQGEVAQAIANKVQGHATNPGKMTLKDLADYRAVVRAPLCFDYAVAAHTYRICGMPPPSSGTLAIGQILNLLGNTPTANVPLQAGLPPADWLHLYTEASRLAFADRDHYVADPDFVQPPAGSWQSLLQPGYLAQRAKLINTAPGSPRMADPAPGKPGPSDARPLQYGRAATQVEAGTSHISVIDAQGHGVAMTTTIEDAFGARQMVNRGKGLTGGFLLNNELTDFNFAPTDAAGLPVANRIEPGKRPRSSMAPTLVFDKATGQLLISAGSPGGAVIIHYTAKTLYGMLNWGLNAQEAINLPNFGTLGGPAFLEAGRFAPTTAQALRTRGHKVYEVDLPSGIQAIARTPQGFFGGADPRREGVVLGD
ncbi:MAG: gamma-glutamyltransferase [Burkholderiales bacterium PBB3]|nr:MAG: gamma-glutamyltransferase [Burkholderiales bacterium PBB3]